MNLNPKKGALVKILFYDGLVEEGIVYFWSDQKSAIQSQSGSLLVIQKTLEDVKCYQIVREPKKQRYSQDENGKIFDSGNAPPMPPNRKEPSNRREPPKATNIFINEEIKPEKYYRDPSLRAANLAELRLKLAEEERERARIAMTSFTPNGLQNNTYDNKRLNIPGRLQTIPKKLESVSQHPFQEIRGKHRTNKKKVFER